jgi:hypothetical protein
MRAKPLGSFFVPWESDGPEITPDSLRAIADVLEMPYELRPRWPQAPAPPDGGHGGE